MGEIRLNMFMNTMNISWLFKGNTLLLLKASIFHLGLVKNILFPREYPIAEKVLQVQGQLMRLVANAPRGKMKVFSSINGTGPTRGFRRLGQGYERH